MNEGQLERWAVLLRENKSHVQIRYMFWTLCHRMNCVHRDLVDEVFSRELHFITVTIRDLIRARLNETCDTTVNCLRRIGVQRDMRRYICAILRDAYRRDLQQEISIILDSTNLVVTHGGGKCWKAVLAGMIV